MDSLKGYVKTGNDICRDMFGGGTIEKHNKRLSAEWVPYSEARLYEVMFHDGQRFTEWIVKYHPEILKEWARSFGKEISIGGGK